jgi:D-alanyl-D-alanine carboxypeptidase
MYCLSTPLHALAPRPSFPFLQSFSVLYSFPVTRLRHGSILLLLVLPFVAATLPAQKIVVPYTGPQLTKSEIAQVDSAAREILRRDNVPGLSLAIVRNGEIAYRQAYGFGELSKEFTAAAILLLADRGKLSLDDPVSKFLPHLTSADRITVRQLLNHTSGYSDYFLQEYIPARTQQPTTVDAILKEWGERPLDFSPGEDWQYSSTNYVIAGRIVEIASGEPYHKFLEKNRLLPLRPRSASSRARRRPQLALCDG